MSSKSKAPAPSVSQLVPNLFNNGAAIATQVGAVVVAGSVATAVLTNPVNLFSAHPFFVSTAFLLIAEALLLVQPTPASPAHKTLSGQVHGLTLVTAAILYAIAGATVFYIKIAYGKPHFTSWHGKFGLATSLSLTANILGGVVQFWFPKQVLGSEAAGKQLYKYHRLGGYCTLVLMSTTILLGLQSNYNQDIANLSYWIIGPAIALTVGGLFSRLQVHKIRFW